jgi:hypothetical protein
MSDEKKQKNKKTEDNTQQDSNKDNEKKNKEDYGWKADDDIIDNGFGEE